MTETRIETDSFGEIAVPASAYWGAQTQRSIENFPFAATERMPLPIVHALALVKQAAARVNRGHGLDGAKADAIEAAAAAVAAGAHDDQFPLVIWQTGSGTQSNMNVNEVIAGRANEVLTGTRGGKSPVHPNDNVNMSQSSNDSFPTALHIAASLAVTRRLFPALDRLKTALQAKADAWTDIVKIGRTHLQDATPLTLGQEFGAYANQVYRCGRRIEPGISNGTNRLAQGGTAVGTGLNTHPEFAARAIAELNKIFSADFCEAKNHFEAQGSRDAIVELSGQLRTIACSMLKIAHDIRWLASGPRCGLGEILLPETQPGSSIMPAKVNPVICESVMMAAAHVMGNDACIAVCGQHGNFELNVMLPVMGYNIIEAIELLAASAANFTDKCISGIEANVEKCREYAEKSLSMCTSLAPKIGYDKAAAVAKQAFKEDKTVRQVVLEGGYMDAKKVEEVLDLEAMTKPGL